MCCIHLILVFFPQIKQHFHKRLFSFLAATCLDSLVQDGNTFSQGIQLKLLLTRLEDWARTKLGPESVKLMEQEFGPAREAANVVCLPHKSSLVDPSNRANICPLLRPIHIHALIEHFLPDQFDKEVVPNSLLSVLIKQDKSYQPSPDTFNPLRRTPLDLSFDMPYVCMTGVALPKRLLHRIGFAFLKGLQLGTKEEEEEQKGEPW